MTTPADFLPLAHRLADAAGLVIAAHFRTPIGVDDKADASPVTIADREAEARMRALLAAEVPSHGVLGEEHGADRTSAEWVWVLDPIDGTKAFITGMPLFGTLIALVHRGEPVLGIIDQPISRERWVGVRGAATTWNGRPITTRPCRELASAYMYSTHPGMFAGKDADAYARLGATVKLQRFGGDCYAAGLVALGFADLMVEGSLQAYDYCALVPVVEGAGGVVTGWRGERLGLDAAAHGGKMIAAGDRALHAAALELLR
jgi:histidinol phosphatase-like enzyme (inositol monophosphatase family)